MSELREVPDDTAAFEANRQAWLAERSAAEQKRAERERHWHKMLATVAGGSLLVTGGFIAAKNLGGEGKATTEPDVRPPSVGASVTPGEQVPSNTPETQNPNTAVQTIEQVVSLETMEAMSLDEFVKLPYADRAAYAYLRVPELPSATPEEKFDPTAVPGYYWQQINQTGIGMEDSLVGTKIFSSIYYYVTDKQTGEISESFQAIANEVSEYGGAGMGIGTSLVYVDNGETQLGQDRDGNEIGFTNITYEVTDRETGEHISERTSQVFQFQLKLEDGRTIVVYPTGYGIDGKQSPVEGYPY